MDSDTLEVISNNIESGRTIHNLVYVNGLVVFNIDIHNVFVSGLHTAKDKILKLPDDCNVINNAQGAVAFNCGRHLDTDRSMVYIANANNRLIRFDVSKINTDSPISSKDNIDI